MECCLLVWAFMCCSWLALRDAVVVLGVSWALFGAFAMFVFFLEFWEYEDHAFLRL